LFSGKKSRRPNARTLCIGKWKASSYAILEATPCWRSARATPKGVPLSGLKASAHLAHPADARLDLTIPMKLAGDGAFRGEEAAAPGQWELIIDLSRGDERLFRSRSRVTLR